MSETSVPTSQPPARPAPRVPTSHGDQSRAGGTQGAPLEGPEPPGSVTWRAQGRSTFDRLRQGVKVRSGPLTVCWAQAPAEGSSPALAFAIGKRVGNAVVRNRLKRRLREAARRLEVLPAGLYLVRASPGAAAAQVPGNIGPLAARRKLAGEPAKDGRSGTTIGRTANRAGRHVIIENSQQPTRNVTASALKALITVYRAASGNSRPACRFVPSCSQYAVEALDQYGARQGVTPRSTTPGQVPSSRAVRLRPSPAFSVRHR